MPDPNMTSRQKRNLTLAKQRRIEKARAAYTAASDEVKRWVLANQSRSPSTRMPNSPEWYGHPPQGVTVQ